MSLSLRHITSVRLNPGEIWRAERLVKVWMAGDVKGRLRKRRFRRGYKREGKTTKGVLDKVRMVLVATM